MKLTQGSLFSGIGGFELAGEICGIKTIWNSEIEQFQSDILKKNFSDTKQYGDIRNIENPESVDIICGGFPCQDISIAGEGEGIKGERSGLWSEMYRVVGIVRPKYVIIENSAMLAIRGFEQILCDLSKIGYNAEWQCLSGTSFGIQQNRERLYCIAYPDSKHQKGSSSQQVFRQPYVSWKSTRVYPGWKRRSDLPESRFLRATHGFRPWLDRVAAVGNCMMPLVGVYIYHCIIEREKLINQSIN